MTTLKIVLLPSCIRITFLVCNCDNFYQGCVLEMLLVTERNENIMKIHVTSLVEPVEGSTYFQVIQSIWLQISDGELVGALMALWNGIWPGTVDDLLIAGVTLGINALGAFQPKTPVNHCDPTWAPKIRNSIVDSLRSHRTVGGVYNYF